MVTTMGMNMKISNRFTMAVHILAMTDILKDSKNLHCTSQYLAKSVNTNAVVIRRIIGKLKVAGIIGVRTGAGGTYLIKEINQISLLDIYNAVEVVEENHLFNCHTDEHCQCNIGANIHIVLKDILTDAQSAMEDVLNNIRLSDIVLQIKQKLICNKS
jgi:Rrf2 family protein